MKQTLLAIILLLHFTSYSQVNDWEKYELKSEIKSITDSIFRGYQDPYFSYVDDLLKYKEQYRGDIRRGNRVVYFTPEGKCDTIIGNKSIGRCVGYRDREITVDLEYDFSFADISYPAHLDSYIANYTNDSIGNWIRCIIYRKLHLSKSDTDLLHKIF